MKNLLEFFQRSLLHQIAYDGLSPSFSELSKNFFHLRIILFGVIYFSVFSNAVGQITYNSNNVPKATTNFGYLEFGPKNTTSSHFLTDRPKFYFNKEIRVNGAIGSYSGNLNLRTAGTTAVTILNSNGYVGIGTTNPETKLHIENPAGINGTWLKLTEGVVDYRISNEGGRLKIREGTNDRFVIRSGGNIGIGVKSPDSKLVVAGNIKAEEIILEDVTGADYVFEEDYDLRSLEETEKFIKANKHLPEIPSAAEMAEEGLALKEMNILLLQKVEELTLHLIRQEKEAKQNTEELTAKLLEQEKEIQSLKATQND